MVTDSEIGPSRIGRYDVLLPLASGGAGTVYLARQRGVGGFDREVALKLTHRAVVHESEMSDELIEEAKLATRIRHPNVVAVLDAGEDPQGVFLIMQYVEGETLAGLLRGARKGERELPLPIALRMLLDGISGLHAAHELKSERGEPLSLVHRDFSPQNLLVGVDGIGRLSDFGIAKALSRAGVTATGTVKGKLGYMSPEQVRGKSLDRRSDVWAAGVVAWEILTRKRLFTAADQQAVLFKIVSETAPRARSVNPDIPEALDEVVAGALARDPEQRIASAEDLRRRIDAAATSAGIAIASTSDVARFMEESLAEKLASRHAQIAAARAKLNAYDDSSTIIEPSFVRRHAMEVAEWDDAGANERRPRTRTRSLFVTAAIAIPSVFIASRLLTPSEHRPTIAPVATIASASPVVSASEVSSTEAPPTVPKEAPASSEASRVRNLPKRVEPAPHRPHDLPRALPPASTSTIERSPFKNPYEGAR
ncbi:MAG: uncharacterized protein K0S65_284 [Labilithrix sp.]|nr:uncharacterized protein [Labilithrix sp.]